MFLLCLWCQVGWTEVQWVSQRLKDCVWDILKTSVMSHKGSGFRLSSLGFYEFAFIVAFLWYVSGVEVLPGFTGLRA